MSKFLRLTVIGAVATLGISPAAACPNGWSGTPCHPGKYTRPGPKSTERKIALGKSEQAPPRESPCRIKGPNGRDLPVVPPPAGC